MKRVFLAGIAALLFLPSAYGQGVDSAGYSCYRAQEGDFGRLSARISIDDDGVFHINKSVAASSGEWDLKLNVIEGHAVGQHEIKVYFERNDADFSKPLRFAWLSTQYYIYPLPQSPTYMFLTLNTGEHVRRPFITASMIREWKHNTAGGFGGAFQTDDRTFFQALLRAASFAVDIIDADGTQVSHTVYAPKDFASVVPVLERLDGEAIAAMRNYRTACQHIEIVWDPVLPQPQRRP